MSIKNLFFADYWFSQPYILHGLQAWVYAGFFAALAALGILALIWRTRTGDKSFRKFFANIGNFGMTMAFFGIVWFIFREERVIFLAWRVWMFIWAVIFLAWGYRLVFYGLKRLPQIKAEKLERELKEKYLPV